MSFSTPTHSLPSNLNPTDPANVNTHTEQVIEQVTEQVTEQVIEQVWCDVGEHFVDAGDMWPNFADCQNCCSKKEYL